MFFALEKLEKKAAKKLFLIALQTLHVPPLST